MYNQRTPKKKPPKIGRWILLLLIIYLVAHFFTKPISINSEVVIKKWDTFQNFLEPLSSMDRFRMKLYIKGKNIDFSRLDYGTYSFSGDYSRHDFVSHVLKWPEKEYVRYTILEWRSIYDIDHDLANKGYIEPGEFLAFINDKELIDSKKLQYEFLQDIDHLYSLEGFLYPDTYNIDIAKNFMDQLVILQLNNFEKKVWDPHKDEISNFSNRLEEDGYKVYLDRYDIVTLASVVEKEERLNKNKPTVSGIFIHRLDIGMRLDADITLCYGLKKPYETCTPSVIVKWLYDKNNAFNTRQVAGIPPQPIANPAIDTITAVLNYKKTSYLYYLHDMQGKIYYAKTISEHNRNKNLYLK